MVSPTQWTWVWVNSGSWWWTGRPGICCPWGHKESDMTEWLNWTPGFNFPHSSLGKKSACNAGDPGSIPGLGRSPGEGNSFSILAWRTPWIEEPGGLQFMVLQVRHDLATKITTTPGFTIKFLPNYGYLWCHPSLFNEEILKTEDTYVSSNHEGTLNQSSLSEME